jgi:hypothetical protein
MARKRKVWRFQRSALGDVVSAMTHDRQYAVHFELDEVWELNFDDKLTFYAEAVVVGSLEKPRLRILKLVTEGEWI